jgi:hypothetical protein
MQRRLSSDFGVANAFRSDSFAAHLTVSTAAALVTVDRARETFKRQVVKIPSWPRSWANFMLL